MIYFLSDAHIGSRAIDYKAHEQVVCNCLQQLGGDASAIYLLGDMFDFGMNMYGVNHKNTN